MSAQLKTTAEDMSFPKRVWYVLSRVDVSDRLKKKGRFDYLPWADAWELLMEHYPESSYRFDEPRFWDNGTGEQWVHVTVKDGDDEFTRSWWLPYLDHSNKALMNPSSLQINNTRMRALVKCIAMLGLGVHVFSGEDVPDAQHDQEPVVGAKRMGVSAAVMEDITLTDDEWAAVKEWQTAITEAAPKDAIRWEQLASLHKQLRESESVTNDQRLAINHGLQSWQRSALKKLNAEYDERAKAAAVAKIQGSE